MNCEEKTLCSNKVILLTWVNKKAVSDNNKSKKHMYSREDSRWEGSVLSIVLVWCSQPPVSNIFCSEERVSSSSSSFLFVVHSLSFKTTFCEKKSSFFPPFFFAHFSFLHLNKADLFCNYSHPFFHYDLNVMYIKWLFSQ